MDYGAALWRHHGDLQSFRTQLEAETRRTLGADLDDAICRHFGIEREDAAALLASVDQCVADGRFRFVVLMDRLDDPMKDLISFINENSRFDVYGVELQLYRFDGYEVTIPKLYGAEARKEVAGGSSRRRRWDEASYFKDAEEKLPPEHLASLRRLYDFAVQHADRITWGTGNRNGSFNAKYDRVGPKSVYTAYSDGSLMLNLAWHRDHEGRLPAPAARLARRLEADLADFTLPKDFAGLFVTISADVWAPQVETLIRAIRKELGAS